MRSYELLHIWPEQNSFFFRNTRAVRSHHVLNGLEHGSIHGLGKNFISPLEGIYLGDEVNVEVFNIDETIPNLEKFVAFLGRIAVGFSLVAWGVGR